MPKPVNCCVPGCFNNFRNSSGLQYYRIPKDSFLRKEYKRLLRNETLKLNSDNTRICSTHFEGGKKRDRNQLPSIFPWLKPTAERRELKRVNQTEVKIQRKRRKVTNHNTVLHEELRESGMQPACNSILEASEAGFHHCCVSYASVGTQTDEPMDLREKKFQELYFVVYICLLFIFAMLHNMKICVQEKANLKKETLQLRYLMEHSCFDINDFKDNPEDISFFTGFADYQTMMLCYDIVKDPAKNLSHGVHERKVFNAQSNSSQLGRPRKLTTFQEFVLVLMKLRLGLFNRDLAHRFKVSLTSVSVIFRTWIRFLRTELQCLIRLPPREVLQLHMPVLFKEYYPQTVLIIDCTEIEMEKPSALDNQSACYSSYKSRTTMKSLIGITPSGATAFVSELFPGSTSDKEITVKSGLLNLLQAGDEIMADKGFLIQDELASVGALLTIPAFLKGRKQFTKEEAEKNKKVACLRVHVERCMERIKNWHILDSKIPITLAPFASDIFIVIAAFTNFLPPLIQ
ncbi:uncharacterized protein [Acropora muricata]|uniref:uncharacterized protein n=1 Tax=Acropora muricata TaxID=159855 RepID=UPI0034E4F3A9